LGDGEFDVHLARAQRVLRIGAQQSILDALLQAGLDVPHSCRDGVCASCETRVLAGECDHRDLVLMPAEAAANDRMMICVSRCKGDSLTLDL
jgi:ferredoxin